MLTSGVKRTMARRSKKERKQASKYTKAHKESKKMQREARTKIRQAMKQAANDKDVREVEAINEKIQHYIHSLTPAIKEGLPKSFQHNVKREMGKTSRLKKFVNSKEFNKKKQKRVATRTMQKIFGKQWKNVALDNHWTGGDIRMYSNEFWRQLYIAQDYLASTGLVSPEQIYGRNGSIGSDLLQTGKDILNDGYWQDMTISFKKEIRGAGEVALVVTTNVDDSGKVTTRELSAAIVQYYQDKFNMR